MNTQTVKLVETSCAQKRHNHKTADLGQSNLIGVILLTHKCYSVIVSKVEKPKAHPRPPNNISQYNVLLKLPPFGQTVKLCPHQSDPP